MVSTSVKYKIFIAVISLLTIAVAALIGRSETLGLSMAGMLVVVIPVVLLFWNYPIFGFLLTLTLSYFLLGILRFVDLPLGTVMDGMVVLLFMTLLWEIMNKRYTIDFKNGLNLLVLIWILYNILQLANPFAASREAWVYTIRAVALTLLLYYVAVKIFSGYINIKLFVGCWLVLSLALALYGMHQEFNGLSETEEAWARATEERFLLLYNWGRFRKFSFFPDPTTFGVTCAYSGVFALVLAIGKQVKLWQRLLLFMAAGIMFFSMVFSGTRTAYIMPVAALIFYVCLNFNWKVVTVFSIFFAIGAGIIVSPIKSLGPLDANNLERIRSAFMPSDDPSFQVRLKNQRFIQPIIQKNPLGGGLGSTGQWGKRFSPWSPLSQFPPDSGFVKIAVEQGTIGLLIYCLMLFYMFKQGVQHYFLIENQKIRNILAAVMTTLFSIVVANYAQETITMYPTSIIFYGCMGILMASKKFIQQENLT